MDDKKYVGTVVWFQARPSGYGFIEWDDGIHGDDTEDIFIHWSDIAIDGFKTINKGDKVAFSTGFNKSGVIKATQVIVIEPAPKT